MPQLTISGTIIDFPDSAADPNWAPAVIQFATLVSEALSGVVGPYDVSPQVINIDSSNPGTAVDIQALNFPTAFVRAAFIRYSLFRTADSPTSSAYESGNIIVVYNPNGSIGSKWELIQNFAGDGEIVFSIADTGQVKFTTTQIGTTNHVGRLTVSAQALLQN